MSKQINFFLLLAIITVFAACNNAAKPAETIKDQSQNAPAMSAKEIAMSDNQKIKESGDAMKQNGTLAKKQTANAKSGAVKDISSASLGDRSNARPKTDADKLRQRAAAQQSGTQTSINDTTDPAKIAKNKAKATVKNTKVSTPTVITPTVNTPSPEVPKEILSAPTHEDWNALLTANVSNTGKVNYNGFKGSQTKLNAYLDKLKSNPPVASWSRNEKMAYWINAYNAFTVKKIVDNYPLGSIQELSGGKVWDDKWINIGDKSYSLNEIENGILRPTYKDARIHFAVNCAAKSCPSLHNRAFTAGNIESKLASLTKKFVNNADFNTITAGKVTVSKIFDWYASDFGDLKEFLNKYSNTPINADAAVDYTEYNWSLNE